MQPHIATLERATPETILRAELPRLNMNPESGEQTYHLNPPNPGGTIMDKRQAAVLSLLCTDAKQTGAPLGPSWWK